MKKLCVAAILAVFSLVNVNAQTSFGVKAGFHNLSVRTSTAGVTGSVGQSGFFAGIFTDISLSEKFHLQPEVNLGVVSQNGSSGKELIIPIMVKYYVAEKFNIQAGPQADIILDNAPQINKFGLGLGIGAGFDFTEKFFAATRYTFGLTNRLKNSTINSGGQTFTGVTSKFNIFQVGLGYRF